MSEEEEDLSPLGALKATHRKERKELQCNFCHYPSNIGKILVNSNFAVVNSIRLKLLHFSEALLRFSAVLLQPLLRNIRNNRRNIIHWAL